MHVSAPSPTDVPDLLRTTAAATPLPDPKDFVRSLLDRRSDFGISRVGAITRLDRVGVPVVQVVRPLALSNAVNQGKGADIHQATISAMLEALEMWAGEHIREDSVFTAPAAALGDGVRALYGLCRIAPTAWETESLDWTIGHDLLSGRDMPVPLALVDTRYSLPSPHPPLFPRTTTGLAAGQTLARAVRHAALEVLEKDAVVSARRRPFFFDRWGIDLDSVDGPCEPILARIRAAGLLCGIWQVPANHDLPIYWCRIMEADENRELAPLPADGFGCDPTHDGALAKALLEACQARVGAIAGAREDITRRLYPSSQDRQVVSEWRSALLSPGNKRRFAPERPSPGGGPHVHDRILEALRAEGAEAALVVPLYRSCDPPLHVLRLVVPGLRHGERH